MSVPKITLEQWAAFKAVVDEGTFARAADQLNRSQSAISYAINKLESRLPEPVFDLKGRKAELTAFGKAMYRHASALLAQALQVDKMAQYLAAGWEPEIILAVDGIAPMDRILKALAAFSQESPQTRIRLLETTLSGTDEVLLAREADLVITPNVVPGFLGEPFAMVTKIAVASPKHPLSQLKAPIKEETLKTYRQIVVRDSGKRFSKDAGWLGSEQRWTFTHFGTSIKCLEAGLGFGFIPQQSIETELARGSLNALNLAIKGEQHIVLYLVPSAQQDTGPATRLLMSHLLATRENRLAGL